MDLNKHGGFLLQAIERLGEQKWEDVIKVRADAEHWQKKNAVDTWRACVEARDALHMALCESTKPKEKNHA